MLAMSSLRVAKAMQGIASKSVALLMSRMTMNQEFAFGTHIFIITAADRIHSVSITKVHTRTQGLKCIVKCHHPLFCCPLYVLCGPKLQHVANTVCVRQMTDREMWHSHAPPPHFRGVRELPL